MTTITNCRLFVGVDATVIDNGTVVVEGGSITYSGSTDAAPAPIGAVHDVGGAFVMPGMTESHAHLSYANAHPQQLDRQPIPIAMLDAVDNARRVLAAGFTSAISFGSAQGIDLPLRDVINQGRVPGPRLAASDRDLGSTGSNADAAAPDSEGRKIIADDPWSIRAAVRGLAKKGVDIVKIFLDGEAISRHAPPGILSYTDEEVAAAAEETHARHMRIVCHSRSAAAVKQAIRHNIDIIGHANFLDDEAIAMLAERKDTVFIGPGIAWEIALLERGHEIGLPRDLMVDRGYQLEVDATVQSMKALHAEGVPILVGGDYGLNITPHGTQAKDLEYFVDLFGFSPTDALLAATRDGGRAFDAAGRAGTLEANTWADLVVVDGDPTVDISVLQDPARITGVMKNGVAYRGLGATEPI